MELISRSLETLIPHPGSRALVALVQLESSSQGPLSSWLGLHLCSWLGLHLWALWAGCFLTITFSVPGLNCAPRRSGFPGSF